VKTPRLLANDTSCPCRSGKTFGACCLREGRAAYHNGIPVIQMPFPPPEFAEILSQESQRQTRFGQVRPAVHADWRGQKWVAVGNQLLNSPKWKTPADFFLDYLKHVMTPEWGNAELAMPLTDRHPVMQWYDAVCRLQALTKQRARPDGVFGVAPSGAMRAYSLLAYDLYILQHHRLLEARLLHRLRHKDQYQGARHELFAAATFVRAGFDIDYEDESDGSSKHTEFTATHPQTGFRLCVEAKSKHRRGVLGMKGDRDPVDATRTRLGKLINDALKKPHKHPLAIFLDLNLPPASPAHGTAEWFEKFADPILRGIDRDAEEDPWDLLVFSNQPDHYATDDGPAPGGYALGILGKNARIGSQPPSELLALIDAANKFGALPNRFEEM
jgi:SEC-C motif-containing protein